MKNTLKPVKGTWSIFFGLGFLDIIVTVLSGLVQSDIFWYQILWGAMIAESIGINTSGGGLYTPSTTGWVVLVLTILANIFILYLLALFLSKKALKNTGKGRNKPQSPRFEMPDRQQ